MTTRLARADLAACFDLFGESAFRLETLRAYNVPAEAESLRAFRLGLPLPERSVRTSPWLARIHQTTAAGKSWSRIRVTCNPLTEYERYQMLCYPDSARAGEIIWIADRSVHPGLDMLDGDFWLFDEDSEPFVAVMAYDGDGAYLGSKVTADSAVIDRCKEHKRFAERYAVPLDPFLVHLGQHTA
jgi:hypothetical protein